MAGVAPRKSGRLLTWIAVSQLPNVDGRYTRLHTDRPTRFGDVLKETVNSVLKLVVI